MSPNTAVDPILVTGATGRHGGTGPLLLRMLRQGGNAVRAMVHIADDRSGALQAEGIEIAVADFRDHRALEAALQGVKRAYFCYPVNAGIVEATANFAAVGRNCGLEIVVSNSMGAAHPRSPSPLARAQWLSEQVLNWAGFRCAHLRGGFFYENILLFSEATILQDGLIENSFGDGSMTWMAGEDMARVAATMLTQRPEMWPALEDATQVLWLSGPQRLNFTVVADVISKVLGQPVRYRPISDEAWKEQLLGNPKVNPAMADHLSGLARVSRAGMGMPINAERVFRLTGRQPLGLEGFFESWHASLSGKPKRAGRMPSAGPGEACGGSKAMRP
jgi:uncharacterized protein YbjT (DUF2867 family)